MIQSKDTCDQIHDEPNFEGKGKGKGKRGKGKKTLVKLAAAATATASTATAVSPPSSAVDRDQGLFNYDPADFISQGECGDSDSLLR